MNIFGLEITKKKPETQASVISPMNTDGSTEITAATSGYYAQVMELDSHIKTENDLIKRYREIAQYADCDSAIEDICNEAIIFQEDKPPIEINLDMLKVSDGIKDKITEEFERILELLDFDNNGFDLFRIWYIDGRIFFNVLVDESKPREGIVELRLIDPRKIRKIKTINKTKLPTGVEIVKAVDEYYLYNDKGLTENSLQGIKLPLDSVIYSPSGLTDGNTGMTIGHLQKAVKLVNQLKMMEDALVIYRISRAPERRVFYVDVGNLPKIKAEQYVNDLMNKFRNKVVYDATTGEVTSNKKQLCLAMDTKVPLLDGRELSITAIANELNEGKKLWAYSCDPITGKFAPGPITWAGVTRPNAPVMKITLDNGETITCTKEHRFPVWGKGLVEAKNLAVGESMIPLYRQKTPITKRAKINKKDYEQIFDNEGKKWVFTHREVSMWKDTHGLENEMQYKEKYNGEKKTTIHHKNYSRFDNSPDNLARMSARDHIAHHSRNEGGKIGRAALKTLMSDKNFNEWFREQQRNGWTEEAKLIASEHAKRNNLSERGNAAQKVLWETPEKKEDFRKKYATEYLPEHFVLLKECAISNMTSKQAAEYLNQHVSIDEWKSVNINKVGTQKNWDLGIHWKEISKICEAFSGKTWAEYKETVAQAVAHNNHKIASIEYLEDTIDTGCLTIDGDGKYKSHHIFALSAGIYSENSMLEDFWMPRREGGKGTEITTLPGGQNLSEISDIEWFQQKLFQALKVPMSRLKGENPFNVGTSSQITRDEIKFNKFITRIRKRFSSIFADALKIQLILKGIINPDEWSDIKQFIHFDFMKDNYFSELKDSEILNSRLASLQQIDPFVGKYFDIAWVRKNVLQQTESDVKEIDKGKELDQEIELQNAAHRGNVDVAQQAPMAQFQNSMNAAQNNEKAGD